MSPAATAEPEPETGFSGIWRKWQAGYNPRNAQARTMHLNASFARIQAKLHARVNTTSTNDRIDEKDDRDSTTTTNVTGEVIASSTQECAAAQVSTLVVYILSLTVCSGTLAVA